MTGFRHGVGVKGTGSAGNMLKDLIQRMSKLYFDQEGFGFGFSKIEVRAKFQITLIEREGATAAGADQAGVTR